MTPNRRAFSAIAALLLAMLACNLPAVKTPTPLAPEAALTIAAQTIEAQFTQKALLTPSAPPVSNTPEPPAATITPAASLTATPTCDLAEFIADVTIPDGSPFPANQNFTKTWRLKNTGACTWTSSYQVIFDSGEAMSGPATQPLAGSVAPGQTVDVSVNLKAPASPGSYRGYWKLRNPAGVLIPILHGHQGTSFFVDIKVVPPTDTITPTPTTGLIIILPPIIFIKSPTPTPTLLPIFIPTLIFPLPKP